METIRAAHAEERPSERPIIAYFFCDYKEPRRRSVAEVLRCLLSQILKENVANNGLVDVFTFIQSGSASATASSTVELWELLQLALGQLPRAYLVIDGIDECIDSEDLSNNLRRLSLQPNLVRVLAIGRLNDPVLQKNFGQCPQLTITSDGNTDDIFKYIHHHIDKICESGFDSEFTMSRSEIISRLATGSNGMFLWARLMVELLSSHALYPHQRSDILRGIGVPEGLEELYGRIFQILSTRAKHERNIASKVFMWVACGKETLTASELEIALVQEEFSACRAAVASLRNFTSVVLIACGGLVEVTRGMTLRSRAVR